MRAHWGGVIAVWGAAAVGAVLVLLLVAPEHRWAAWPLVLAGSLLLTFGIQLAVAEKQGFVTRLIASSTGALAVLLVGGLVAVATG